MLQVQTDVKMKFLIELVNGDRTQPQMQPTVPTVLLLPTTYYRVFLLSFHTNQNELDFYRHQSLHTTARTEAAIPTGPNYHGYLFYLSEFPPG